MGFGDRNSGQVVAHPDFRPTGPRCRPVFNKAMMALSHFHQAMGIHGQAEGLEGLSRFETLTEHLPFNPKRERDFRTDPA